MIYLIFYCIFTYIVYLGMCIEAEDFPIIGFILSPITVPILIGGLIYELLKHFKK